MKKKTILVFLLTAAISLTAFAGCSNNNANSSSSSGNSSQISSEISSDISSEEGKVKSGMLKDVHEAVKNAMGEGYAAQMAITDEAQIADIFGLSKDMYKEIIAEMPMMNVKVDTFIAVEAAEGKADDVEKALNDYRDKLVKEKEEFPYLPDHLPKTKASKVFKMDDYVFFVMLGNIPEDTDEANFQKAADDEVTKVIETIKTALGK